ncbi:MAG TPA: hypothetical protein ENH01_08585 [Nitrospirae bacterium]|nr:hypothetical protein [Nitrospirota bacterium]
MTWKILDCTIRDGGYYTDWDFDQKLVKKYFNEIETLPVNIIEVGYRSHVKDKYFGEYYYLPTSTINKLHEWGNGKISLALMLNAKEFCVDDVVSILDGCQGIIELIRFAIAPDNISSGINLAGEVKRAGFNVTLNIMYLHEIIKDTSLFESICGELESAADKIDYVYFVDSYGSCMPEEIHKFFLLSRQRISQKIGFHGHDNIGLAFANTLSAINAGVDIVDSTILGMGRGAGNARTELLAAYFAKQQGSAIDLSAISELVEEFILLQKKYEWGSSIPYIVSGFEQLPQKEVMELTSKRRYSTGSIVKMLQGNLSNGDTVPHYPNLNDSKLKKQEDHIKTAIIIGGGGTAIRHNEAVIEYSTRGNTLIIHSSLKNVESYKDYDGLQVACLVGEEANKMSNVGKEIDKIHTFIVSSSPRIEQQLPESWNDRTFTVNPLWTDSNKKGNTNESPLNLSLSIAREMKVDKVLLVGFDGYPAGKVETKVLAEEVQQTIDQFLNDYPEITLHSITPTLYKVPQSSVYACLSDNN